MSSVVITGASGALGRRVVSRLAQKGTWSVVAIDEKPFPAGVAKPRHFTAHRVSIATAPLERLITDADAIIHLATVGTEGSNPVERDAQMLQRTLTAADAAGIKQLILLSSATVYGAWPDNPVPLLETAALRPNPMFDYAQQKLASESRADLWRAQGAERVLTTLRPATTLGHPDSRAWLADAVRPNIAERVTAQLPATQFVHVDDLAEAIVHALELRLDGAYNVASHDWLTSDQAHSLFGPTLGFAIPEKVEAGFRMIVERFSKRPPGAADFVRFPCVVATDRLTATGWSARSSSAEAYVASKPPSLFSRIYARRRQEVNLAAVTAGSAGLLGVLGSALRWWRNRYLR